MPTCYLSSEVHKLMGSPAISLLFEHNYQIPANSTSYQALVSIPLSTLFSLG